MAEKETLSPDKKKRTEANPAEKAKKKPKHSELEANIAALEAELCTANKDLTDTKNTLMRTAAEYDNYRKRTQKEQEAAFGNGVSHAVLELLPVLDTLYAAANAKSGDEEYKKGVLMILTTCEEVFTRLGISEIEAIGQPFDPEMHNAIMQETCEGTESGTITRVMQKGYLLKDKVVRHSMVAVAP